MPCFHKFFGHNMHLPNEYGLLPNWDAETLIIGTFNPENVWVQNNRANYFYGRSRYFWRVLPRFGCHLPIDNQLVDVQIAFLQQKKIALTDLLISIDDADINNVQHRTWIGNYQDDNINRFNKLNWNTQNILNYIVEWGITTVCFTKTTDNAPFGQQIQIIENFCIENKISNFRLHTPSGQGLGQGRPRLSKLTHTWYNQGCNSFPFICGDFDINNPQFAWYI